MIESRLCACGYCRSEARFRGHRERECRIAQRHVVTSADGFCYLHSRSAVPSGRGKASRHDLPLGPCPNSSRKFLQQTEGGSLVTPKGMRVQCDGPSPPCRKAYARPQCNSLLAALLSL